MTQQQGLGGTTERISLRALLWALNLVAGVVLLSSAGSLTAQEPAPIEAGLAPPPGPYQPGFDALHYGLELSLQAGSQMIQGRMTAEIQVVDPSANEIWFDLTGLQVDEVMVDGAATDWSLSDGRVFVTLPAGTADNESFQVEMVYGGTPDDGLIIQDNVHGVPSIFVDNWPNRTRFWFPTIDHPADKATLDFLIHAPRNWQVIANGHLTSGPTETPADALGGGDRYSWRWVSDVPHPTYTMVVGAAEMVVREIGLAACGLAPASQRDDGCIPVSYWVFPEDVAHADQVFRRAPEIVDYFSDLVGPYPYEKLANVQSSTRFGGMENSSAIFYSEQAIASGRDIEGTVSHEIAHQWFGDGVTEASWQHLWLSEGFASYFGALFFEMADGADNFRARVEGMAATVVASGDAARPVIYEEETNLFELLNANNYQKGGMVLHMLRGLLGDDAFFAGVREYYSTHMNGAALTDDLQHALENTSGRELGWFFDQWLREPGYPMYRVGSTFDGTQQTVTITVEQVQEVGWPTFRLPTEVELSFADGSMTRVPVDIMERRQTFTVPADQAPTATVLDPDGWLLKVLVNQTP